MKEIRRSTFREIKSSFGRFMAIFGIIALGVGFFSGLKVAKEAMLNSVKGYLDSHSFYDFRLLSTLGFEQEDVDSLREQADVEAAEGALSFDVLYRLEDDSQGVLKTHSLTENLNTVKLLLGRFPEKADECLADCNRFSEADIGKVIYLSEDNEEDTLDSFGYGAYTIVGTVQSPLYLQYERGNTSLGTGRVDGFLYLMEDGYDTDYYTEIYVRLQEDYPLYSEEYKDFIDEKEGTWEDLTATAADRRYQSILAEANEKLADAREELADKKAEGEAELADAETELADAEEKLAEGEQALKDARKELDDAEKTLQEKERELAEGKETLETKKKELSEGEAELVQGDRDWWTGKAQLDAGWNELNSQKNQVQQQKKTLEEQASGLEEQAKQLEAGYAYGLVSQEQYEAGMAQVEAGQQEISAARQILAGYEEQISAGESQLQSSQGELTAARRKLDAARQELEQGKTAVLEAEEEIEKGEQAILDGKKELADGKATLEDKEKDLEEARQELADGRKKYEEALEEFQEKIGEAEGKLADAEAEIADIQAPDTYVLGRDTNIGYVCFENDSSIVEGIANIFPVFFFLVAALVCITTMNRMVEEQRTQIGVLKALGYGGGAIMSKYMIYSGLAAVLGCIFGFFLGTWGFPRVIWVTYGIMYRVDEIFYVFDGRLAAISLVVSLLCSVGTTWLSCRMELSQMAAQLMRPKAPKAGKRVFLERIPLLWKHLSFLRKVSVRNIFRYKKRLFMMVLGISGCTALLVTGFGIEDSIADVATKQFEEIQTYDLGISFKDGVSDEMRKELDNLSDRGISDYICVMEKNMDIITDKGIKSIYLVAGDPGKMNQYLDMHTVQKEEIAYPGDGEGVITHKIASQYGIRVGDTITLRDESMNTLTVTVTAVMENYLYNYVFISEDTWHQSVGTAEQQKTAYVNLTGEADAHELSAALMKLDEVANVTVNADTMNRIGSMMDSLDIIVIVVILCAAGLAFIVLYNLTNINITERIREIATIKVLGFYKKETASYVFRENMILTVLGMALGFVLGHFLHRLVMNEIQIDLIAFDIYVKPVSFLYSGLLTLAFTWFVNKAMGGKLDNISMTESLKSVD